jgi:hypothetical protein
VACSSPDHDSSISSMISLVIVREYLSFQRSSNHDANFWLGSWSAMSMLSSRLLNRPAPVKLEDPR